MARVVLQSMGRAFYSTSQLVAAFWNPCGAFALEKSFIGLMRRYFFSVPAPLYQMPDCIGYRPRYMSYSHCDTIGTREDWEVSTTICGGKLQRNTFDIRLDHLLHLKLR